MKKGDNVRIVGQGKYNNKKGTVESILEDGRILIEGIENSVAIIDGKPIVGKRYVTEQMIEVL